MMKASRLLLGWACAIGCLACGGDDSGGDGASIDGGAGDGDAAGAEDLEALCEDACAHAVACDWFPDAESCAAACPGSLDMFRRDALELQWACLRDLECAADNPGETCIVETVLALEAHPIHEQYGEECADAGGTCTLPGDVCAVQEVVIFSDAYMESQVMPCLDLACEAMSTCLEDNVLDAY